MGVNEGSVKENVGCIRIRALPLTMSCVRARPIPAVLWATHSYPPSSSPEACGISHDALKEDLQLQKSSRLK